jgi:heme-degrading monooxygenase HmoA
MARTPQEDANRKAKRTMHKAVEKVIDEKKKEPIGTKQAEEVVAADLYEAAQEDTQKGQRLSRQPVTQITVVESEPGKQAEALALMTERARFMARQPGFVSITVHRSLDGRRIVNYIQWQSRDSLQAAHQSPEFRKEWGRFDKLTDDIDPHLYEVAHAAGTSDAAKSSAR